MVAHEKLEWKEGGVPVSCRFDDPYFSLGNGLAETRHVFLDGNGLPGRFRPGFHVAELGFGTGLNMLAALIAWRGAGIAGPLRFTSFEGFPLAAADIAQALAAFPEAAAVAGPFLEQWAQGARVIRLPGLEAEVIIGDVRETLPRWQGWADAWFLDGFSPAKNPEMWGEGLMAEVGAHTAPQGSFATYTAAGHVRRALQAAGFQVQRQAGFGFKRHMSVGRLG
ncbi:tRNA U34 5-methylaminomethyl-2-thiouridine-forming methyltransferase MnmC [Gemmobacter megaterium]|uniref:tRNA U34 5-methylaminomethyl-2-thiouridine-forming methyltransferase MnmC n=1 Tax=Gemmobacter megaterium TaxID=1086013 RepID=A0A1N7MMF5_9RHOB|nr:tRNA (5-methylaminomethyl-2-thiouridine)(34)-methyltransferase MnmD [Gemmobacter megaterium]GGE06038.1 FAD-dependent oxidoreductase [Gemmobacter megaterium]SIS87119.1 tRNA U34 5-methylaminomethyl-2-thiouridine-forming methyltransferase MnmC [Gemmobacter megaterium]